MMPVGRVSRRRFLLVSGVASFAIVAAGRDRQRVPTLFSQRGYYILPCRAPTLGFDVYRKLFDDLARDGFNTMVLWVAGCFRSHRFPITWRYNADHENIRNDFLRKLIRYGRRKGIRCLLGFTPFGYDGVNQYTIEHPELKALDRDQKPVQEFGIHSWGWNLCPGKPESQKFMLDYIREMAFEFYPEADGLFIESSDYATCHCPDCGTRHFDHEFRFVRRISDEVWHRNPGATVVVYPHYFSGAKLRFSFSEASASRQQFDPRWTVFFTPHSAAPVPELIAAARGSWWWNEAPARCDIPGIRAGARKAKEIRCTGYLPTFECYSYIPSRAEFGEPWVLGKRQVPFGFGWLRPGESPYSALPARATRVATRLFMVDPDIEDKALVTGLGTELFGSRWSVENVQDTLELCRIFSTDRDWAIPAPLTSPGLVKTRASRGQLDSAKRGQLSQQLASVRHMMARYSNPRTKPERELAHVAQWLAGLWDADEQRLLVGLSR